MSEVTEVRPAKKIAVVVVHGVADQQQSESARQIANLLADLCPLGTYSTFQEEKIRVALDPVTVPEVEPLRRSPFEERNHDAILRHRGTPPPVEPDQGFMRDQLRGYYPEGGPRVFETVRLDGVRNETGCRVHVYEAYWADLSRLGKSAFAFFGALYQLLLHLPSLGRNAVDYARAENGNAGLWRPFSWFHRWSIRWLTLFIVVFNLVLASLILPALAPRLTRPPAPPKPPQKVNAVPACCGLSAIAERPGRPEDQKPTLVNNLAHAALALAFIGIAAWVLRRRRPPGWIWALAPIAAAAAGWGVADVVCRWWTPQRVLVFEAWAISALLIWALLAGYESMRRGARLVGGIALLATGAALLKQLSTADGSEDSLSHAVIRTLQIVNMALQLTWRIHVPWLLITIVIGLLCWATTAKAWKRRAWNTIWTARTTLTLSTALFANLTLAIWAAIFTGVQQILPSNKLFQPLDMGECLTRFFCLNTAAVTPAKYLQNTLMVSASRGFINITIIFGIFALAAIWAIFPSVLAEKNPLKKQDSATSRMRALGVWLSRGLNFIPAAAEIFALLLVVGVGIVWFQTVSCDPPAESSWKAISAAGALLLLLIGARFWLPGAKAALDVILDVDNYLRQHPKNNTPRARIAERCASLFRFLLDRDQCGHQYDQVVIIAHSQGTIITADLLRFLKQENDPLSADLQAKNPAFFTMGNPLRQLYARAFPGLYPWVWQPQGPQPDDLAVTEWVNAYCSGDYVGRIVWRELNDPRIWDRRDTDPQCEGNPTVDAIAAGVEQMCIGEGAHTHYWDQHGGDIAWKLDQLIAARCSR
ncbi:MAG: hypothetical protein AABO58_14695 [Acidobacteriota bacterium]